MSLDVAHAVLHCYPFLRPPQVVPLGNHGGFSGASLWQVTDLTGRMCLRAWPERGPPPERLEAVHGLMETARAAGLQFVPAVLRTREGTTWTKVAGRLWELTAWLPGKADFHENPTPQRLEAICTALARLHLAWSKTPCPPGPCPAVLRRLERVGEWERLIASDWRPSFPNPTDPLQPWAERAWHLFRGHLPHLRERLTAWAAIPLPVQPCLCDVWHAHVLFRGDAVTGLVDYGSVKDDHVAADLARLLGSLVPDDRARTEAALDAYARLKPLGEMERALVRLLDETGTLLGAANWLRWLYLAGRDFEDRTAVAGRLAGLVTRIERWGGGGEKRGGRGAEAPRPPGS